MTIIMNIWTPLREDPYLCFFNYVKKIYFRLGQQREYERNQRVIRTSRKSTTKVGYGEADCGRPDCNG